MVNRSQTAPESQSSSKESSAKESAKEKVLREKLPREKLVETAAALIYRQGWNATGINQILGEAQVPKGSFYYYFHSKEDLGVAIVRYHAAQFQEIYERTLLSPTLNGRAAVEAFLLEQLEMQRRCEWRFGCPLGSFSNEVVATPEEKIASACREAMCAFSDALTRAVERGQNDGSILAKEPADQLGMQISSLWQGAMLFMKTHKSEAPLRGAMQCICEKLCASHVV